MLSQLNYQDIKALQVFLVVVDCQGVSAAQSSLNMAQSAISLHLKYIEDKFGFILCQRGRSGFALTEEGVRVYQACKNLSESLDIFLEDILKIQEENEVLSGKINIALVDKLPDHFKESLSDCIRLFYDKYPNVILNIEIQSPQEIETKLLNNQVDIGVGYFGRKLKEILYQEVSLEKQRVYYSAQHPLFKQKNITLEMVRDEYAWVKRGYIISDGLIPVKPKKLTATSQHMESTLLFILAGTHLGYLPENYARLYVNNQMLYAVEIEDTSYCAPIYLISKNSYSPLIKLFRIYMLEILKA